MKLRQGKMKITWDKKINYTVNSFNTAQTDLPHDFIKVKFEYTYFLICSLGHSFSLKMFEFLFSVRKNNFGGKCQ